MWRCSARLTLRALERAIRALAEDVFSGRSKGAFALSSDGAG